jgi:hypothetical protein
MDKPNVVLEREKLYAEVWSKPMIKLAREYGLSDNGLRKICKKLRIPVPPVGYWAKLQHGKKVDRMPLPPAHNFPTTHEIAQNREPKTKIVEPPELQEVIDFETREENRIKVPRDLIGPHSLVKRTKEAFIRSKRNHFGILEPQAECLDIRVSEESLNRTLRILNSLIWALLERGIHVEIGKDRGKRQTILTVWGQKILMRISEKIDQRDFTIEEIKAIEKRQGYFFKSRKYAPNGKLTLKAFEEGYGTVSREFTDSEQTLIEDKLNKFIVSLFYLSVRLKRKRLELEEIWRQNEIERQQEEQRRKAIRIESHKVDLLFKVAESWNKAERLRGFVNAVKNSVAGSGEILPGSEIESWLRWAN